VLGLAAERQVLLLAGRVPHLEVTLDAAQVEHGDRDRVRERDGVAQVDKRVHAWQVAILAEAAQQRLGRAPVLGRLEPHRREHAPPRLDLRQLRLGRAGQPRPGDVQERAKIGGDVHGDAVDR
jgi:hypothetical protein